MRLAFPKLTMATWQWLPQNTQKDGSDSEMSDSESTVSSRGASTASDGVWTVDPFNPVTPSIQHRVDAYFAQKEKLGLVTPPRSPSDILRRGPLYDPEDEGTDAATSRSPWSECPSWDATSPPSG
mmetsp:Transcript_14170/g.20956  ORF Transcript_14170/g.20956 Transcript_14170/m.20956 type:complete len:125 (-) Transcript_14170:80-454(-)